MYLQSSLRHGLCAAALMTGLTAAGSEGLSIHINIPSSTLRVMQDGQETARFAVRVGKRDTSTGTGEGFLTEKREKIVFRYGSGPRAGQIITRSYLSPTGETIDMPYDRMRGLKVELDGGREVVLHSTTDYWTIGYPVSNGCVGMEIEDMLKLYAMVVTTPVATRITYQTVEFRDDLLLFHPDFYLEADRMAELRALGLTLPDPESAKNRLVRIERRLRQRVDQAMAELRAGKDARPLRKGVIIAVPLQEFLKPSVDMGELHPITIGAGESFSAALRRCGMPASLAVGIEAHCPNLNFNRLRPGDSFLLTTEEGEVTRLEYSGRQGEQAFDLAGKRLWLFPPARAE